MAKFIMLVGLQGSGKTTLTKEVSKREKLVILSSDDIREKLFGSRVQDRNTEVFNIMNEETKKYLKMDIDVIYDATNVNSKRRKALLSQLPKDAEKTCFYMMTDKKECINRDRDREHCVGEEVIERTYMNLQVPMYHEGWDDIVLYLPKPKFYPKRLDTILHEKPSLLKIVDIISLVGLDPISLDVEQGNPHHNETILDHTCRTYDYIYRNYNGKYKEELLLASIFHDVGKLECKKWNDDKGHYTYYNHEKVSAQIALKRLSAILPNELSIMVSTIVALHMRLSWGKDDVSNKKLKKLVGEEMYNLLVIFREADMQR